MAEVEQELYVAVEETLESKGVLSMIRAQLRAAVFEAIIDAEGSTDETPRERVRLVPHGDVALALVADFLATCGLRRALCVLVPEAGLGNVDRADLRRKLGLGAGDDAEPILSTLLQKKAKDDYEDDFDLSEEESVTDNVQFRGALADSSDGADLGDLVEDVALRTSSQT